MKQNKVKTSYCKAHGCFDDCASKVSKIMDDGIHHLTSVERVRRSPETRTGGLKPLLEVGRRKLDGTPKTGTDSSLSSKINADVRSGRSSRSRRVGSTDIREQVGKALNDPFEVELSKSAYTAADRHLERVQYGGGQVARVGIPTAAGSVLGGMLGGAVAGKPGAAVGLAAGGVTGARSGLQSAEKKRLARKAKMAKKVSKSAFLEDCHVGA